MTRSDLLARLVDANQRYLTALAELQKVLVEADDDNATLTEMGAALGLPRQTVRGRIRAARKALNR